MDSRLSDKLRKELKKPLGKLYPDVKSAKKDIVGYVIAVGDKVSEALIASGITPDVCVYDGKTKRQEIEIAPEIKKYPAGEIRIRNPAGTLTAEAIKAIDDAIKSGRKTKIFVEGEEDLITLPAIKFAPKDALVIYGQPDEGLVIVKSDLKTKEKAKKIMDEMNIK